MNTSKIMRFSAWAEEVTPVDTSLFNKAPFVPWGLFTPYVNLYPLKIQELYNQSSLLRRVTDYRAAQIAGEGLVVEGEQQELIASRLDAVGFNQRALARLAKDLSLFDAAAMQVVLARDRSRVASVHPTSVAKIRVNKPNELDKVDGYWLSGDWRAVNTRGQVFSKTKQRYLPTFVPKFRVEEPLAGEATQEAGLQLLYDFSENPVSDYYPIPKAESCFDELVFLADVTGFMRNYVENGMVNSAVVYLPFTPSGSDGSLTDEDLSEMERVRSELRETLTGKSNAGSILTQFFDPANVGENGQGMPKWENPIEEENPTKFVNAVQDARQDAMIGLGVVSPDLFGVRTASGFSSQAEQLITADELSFNQDAKPLQEILLGMVRKILERDNQIRGLDFELSVKRVPPVTLRPDPRLVELGIISKNEMREIFGFPAIQSEEVEE